jgi:hypothetical protein
MVEDEVTLWEIDKMRHPTTSEKLQKTLKLSLMSKSEINAMRFQLIHEFKSDLIKQPDKGPYFEKRMNTLPKDWIFDLHEDFLKMKQMKTEKGKEAAKNYIVNKIGLSYNLNGWFLHEVFNA